VRKLEAEAHARSLRGFAAYEARCAEGDVEACRS
jgi:hypothetical protein